MHPRRTHAGRQSPSAPLLAAAVSAQRGRNAGAVRRSSRSLAEYRRDSAALQPRAAAGRKFPAGVPCPGGHDHRNLSERPGCEGAREQACVRPGARRSENTGAPQGVRGPPRDGTRRHHPDGVSRILPHRRRLHPLGQGQWYPGRPGARVRRGFARRLCARYHRSRPPRARPAVRAFPQPGTRVYA